MARFGGGTTRRRPGSWLVRSCLAGALGAGTLLHAALVRADDVDDYTRKLLDLDQRARVLSSELSATEAPPPPDIADRRVLDAQALYGLKQYESAATILLDVIEKYPNSRAYDDAVLLLAESLYQDRDLLSARRYFELATKKNNNSRNEQQALQRLIEIALKTGDFENVDDYLARLEKVPPGQLEPSVPYVRAKYLYSRGKLDEASQIFAQVPPSSLYYFQSRYFLATVAVKKGDLASALTGFDDVLKLQPPDENARDIQDLARLAIGRLHYERNQFDRAVEAYQAVPRSSKYFEDSLYEQAWTHIKAKDWLRAFRSLQLLLDNNPDSKDAPELRLLLGNLNLRMERFANANEAYAETREQFEPIHRQIQAALMKAQSDPAYYDNLLGKNLEKFDISVLVPPSAAKWVRTEPEVERVLTLATDVGSMERDIQESEDTVVKLEKALDGPGRAAIFPDLASGRRRSTEVANQLLEIRQKVAAEMRKLLEPRLSPEERAQLDHIAAERDGLEHQLRNLPTSEASLQERDRASKEAFGNLDKQASELNVEIQALAAQLVALEQYYRSSREQQKIRPEDVQRPATDLRNSLDELQKSQVRLRDEIAEARRETSAAGAAGDLERQQVARLADLLKQERTLSAQVRNRLGGAEQARYDRLASVTGRADLVDGQLQDYDARLDAQVNQRLAKVKEFLATEKVELQQVSQKITGVVSESQSLGGGLAQAMLSKVAERFYDLVVKSDVGIIDVAWGLKDQKTNAVTKLTTQKNLELKGLEDDFRKLQEDEK
jgi:TolA-binding protein